MAVEPDLMVDQFLLALEALGVHASLMNLVVTTTTKESSLAIVLFPVVPFQIAHPRALSLAFRLRAHKCWVLLSLLWVVASLDVLTDCRVSRGGNLILRLRNRSLVANQSCYIAKYSLALTAFLKPIPS